MFLEYNGHYIRIVAKFDRRHPARVFSVKGDQRLATEPHDDRVLGVWIRRRIEVLCTADTAHAKVAMILFVGEVQVLRPEKF